MKELIFFFILNKIEMNSSIKIKTEIYNELLTRNNNLVIELNKIKNENKLYRKQIKEYIKKELKINNENKSTQTNYNDDHIYNIHNNIHIITHNDIQNINKEEEEEEGYFSPISPQTPPSRIMRRQYDYHYFRHNSPPPIQRKKLQYKFILSNSNSNSNEKYKLFLNYNVHSPNINSNENIIENPNENNNEIDKEEDNGMEWNENVHELKESNNENHKEDNENENNVQSIIRKLSLSPVITPKAIQKNRRQTRIPVSYKEPSLNTKIRKGHQFFKFKERIEKNDDNTT